MSQNLRLRLGTFGIFLAAGALLIAYQMTLGGQVKAEGENKYVGAEKCKSCHAAAAKGDQHGKWLATKHAKAFDTLASEQAKKIAKEKNIEDPQKDKACAPCHSTAFDAPATEKHKKFDGKNVQCEACHGPGDKHVKARMAAEDAGDKVVQVGKGEIIHTPGSQTCKACHNEKSPTYKEFKYVERAKQIQHSDPRRGHAADHMEKLEERAKAEAEKK